MEKITTSKLFTKTLILIVILFGVIATATSVLSGWTLYRGLTTEYQSKGIAIAKSVADSSVEILLNRDLSTVQAIIDQFGEIGGVAYVFVSDGQGEMVSHTFVPAVPKEVLPLIEQSRASPTTGEVVTTKLQVKGLGDFIHIYAPILAGVAGFVHVGMDQSFIRAQIWATVVKQQGLMFAILILSIAVAYILVNRISRPLNLLADYTHSLASHDFSAGLDIPAEIESLPQKSKDEIGKLAESFIDMQRTLQRYLKDLEETTVSKERIESELKIAHDIQMSMVPKTFPPFPDRREFDIYATLVPAREVGGDFYDFFFIDDHYLCFAIGDVSGKGVPASLFMALTKTMFRATGGRQNATAETILTRLNGEVCRDNETCMFVTVFCGILDVRTGQVEYSNAGHNLPYVLSNGVVTALPKIGGMALGVTDSIDYHAGRIVLKPGDHLILYTDGVTEAMDKDDQLFSESQLETTLQGLNGSSSKEVIERVVKNVQDFASDAPQSDDITLLVIEYTGLDKTREPTLSLRLKNDLAELGRLNQLLEEFAGLHGVPSEMVFRLTLVMEEILTNVISYGYEDEMEHEISVRLAWQEPEMAIEVEDDGQPFNPLEAPPPDTGKPLAERQIGGLGIHLVREMMDELEYRRENNRNIFILKTKIRET